MNNKSESIRDSKSLVSNLMAWLFGITVFLIGVVNTFWGNDPGFGVFIIVLSLVFIPPTNAMIRKMFDFKIPLLIKVILGVFIIWAALGVGELFDKIRLMMMDF